MSCPRCEDPKGLSVLRLAKEGRKKELCDDHLVELKEERRLETIDRQTRKNLPVRATKKVRHCLWCGDELLDSVPKKDKVCGKEACQAMFKKEGQFDKERPEWHQFVYGGRKATSRA